MIGVKFLADGGKIGETIAPNGTHYHPLSDGEAEEGTEKPVKSVEGLYTPSSSNKSKSTLIVFRGEGEVGGGM